MNALLFLFVVALLITIGVLLVLLYRRTRNVGCLVLAFALAVWPVIQRLAFPWTANIAFEHIRADETAPFPLSVLLAGTELPEQALNRLNLFWELIAQSMILLGVALLLAGRVSGRGTIEPEDFDRLDTDPD